MLARPLPPCQSGTLRTRCSLGAPHPVPAAPTSRLPSRRGRRLAQAPQRAFVGGAGMSRWRSCRTRLPGPDAWNQGGGGGGGGHFRRASVEELGHHAPTPGVATDRPGPPTTARGAAHRGRPVTP